MESHFERNESNMCSELVGRVRVMLVVGQQGLGVGCQQQPGTDEGWQ